MAPSSSSSSTMKKIRIQQTLFKKSLANRQATIFTKAYELSKLCDVELIVICFGPDGELKTYPQDIEKVKVIARRYIELSVDKRRKGSVTLSQVREKMKKAHDSNKKKEKEKEKDMDKEKKKKKGRRPSQVKYPVWYPRFYYYSMEELMELIHSLERNLARMQHRIGVVEARGQRRTHNTNMADEELMMTGPLYHLQQHSNQNSNMTDEELMMTCPMNHLQQYSIQNTNMANQGLVMASTMNYLQQNSNQNTNLAYQNLMMKSTMNHLQQHSIQNTNMAYQNPMMTSTMNHLQQHSNQNTNVAYQNPTMNSTMNSTMNHLQQHSNQNTNVAYQNPTMNGTMNHLQQHSNQFSRFRYENGIFSPTPVSALILNQTQSLALYPPARTIYSNSNMGNYSRSLGVQESGMNGFQNMNMCSYDNNNNIINGVNDFPNQIDQFKVESYSGLLGQEEYRINEFERSNMYSRNLNTGDYLGLRGGQESGTNAMQNVNMQDYNINTNGNALQNVNMQDNNINTNGLSEQSGQFPTPEAAPCFQFGPAGNNSRSLHQF